MARLNRYGFGSGELDRAMAAFVDTFFTRYPLLCSKQRWAEATPENIRNLDYLLRLFPSARFLHVVLDPRDLYCWRKISADSDAQRLAHREVIQDWVHTAKQVLCWRSDVSRYREVRSVDLASQPEMVMRFVLNFLGEPWSDEVLTSLRSCLEEEELGSQFRTLQHSTGMWRSELTASEVAQIEATCGSLLEQLGYHPATAFADPNQGRHGEATDAANPRLTL